MTISQAFSKERVYMMIGIWLAVYPTVTALTYLTADTGWPTYLRTFASTVLTVPLITFVVTPVVDKLIEKGKKARA